MNELVSIIRNHGTKLMGDLLSVVAVISLMDRSLVIELFGERGYSWILLIAGIAIRIRGHVNTAAIKDDIRVEEVAKEAVKVENAILDIQAPKRESP